MSFLPESVIVNVIVLMVAFYALTKGADFLVDGAVGIAFKLNIPKVIIGIVLVSFGTTMPEFTVSLISAIEGHSEIALGNAVGSVIVNVAIALSLGVIFAPKPMHLDPSVYRSVGIIFFGVAVLTFGLALSGSIVRWEGAILIACLIIYLSYLILSEKKRQKRAFEQEAVEEVNEHQVEGRLRKFLLVFSVGLVIVIVSSRFLVESAINIAEYLKISETIIGLTVVAIGTSLPEVATCIVACRKGHADLAFGDIMGANILNLLWIVGGAALARPIFVSLNEIYFMFPFMLGIVGAMYLLTRFGYILNRWKSAILVALYIVYGVTTVLYFFPNA